MNKFFLPSLFAAALALTGCGKKEGQNNGDDVAVVEEVVEIPGEAPTGDTSQMQDPAAPKDSGDTAATDQSDKPADN